MSYAYVQNKIDHMKRLGLVTGSSTGRGKHGGACPDWLRKEQKEREERRSDVAHAQLERSLYARSED